MTDPQLLPVHLRKIGQRVRGRVHAPTRPSPAGSANGWPSAAQSDIPWTVIPPDQDRVVFEQGEDPGRVPQGIQGEAFCASAPAPAPTTAAATGSSTSARTVPWPAPTASSRPISRTGCSRSGPTRTTLFRELADGFGADRDTCAYRVGTGEFTDSLALEHLTGYSRDLVGISLKDYDNVVLELKSKVVDLSWMDGTTDRTDRVLPGMVPERAVHQRARGVRRIHPGPSGWKRPGPAPRRASSVCLHFDPIIRFDGLAQWLRARSSTASSTIVKPEQIAYMSLGSFRCMPQLNADHRGQVPGRRHTYIMNSSPAWTARPACSAPCAWNSSSSWSTGCAAHGMEEPALFLHGIHRGLETRSSATHPRTSAVWASRLMGRAFGRIDRLPAHGGPGRRSGIRKKDYGNFPKWFEC